MKYISTKEAAENWGITPARVHVLIQNGRVPGAKLVGKSWLIPEDAEKPMDSRKKADSKQFLWPLPIYSVSQGSEDSLSREEQRLLEGEKLVMECRYEEARPILMEFMRQEANFFLRIGAIYHLILASLMTGKLGEFRKYANIISLIQSQDFPYKKDIHGIIVDLQSLVVGKQLFLKIELVDPEYTYRKEAFTYLPTLAIYRDIVVYMGKKNMPEPVAYEMMAARFEEEGQHQAELSLYHYIALIRKIRGDKASAHSYLKKALDISQRTGLVFTSAMHYHYMKNEFEEILETMDKSFAKTLKNHATEMKKHYLAFLLEMNKKDLFAALSPEEFRLLHFARIGMTNKEIASEMNLSSITVGRKYNALCRRVGVKRKEDLLEHLKQDYLYS